MLKSCHGRQTATWKRQHANSSSPKSHHRNSFVFYGGSFAEYTDQGRRVFVCLWEFSDGHWVWKRKVVVTKWGVNIFFVSWVRFVCVFQKFGLLHALKSKTCVGYYSVSGLPLNICLNDVLLPKPPRSLHFRVNDSIKQCQSPRPRWFDQEHCFEAQFHPSRALLACATITGEAEMREETDIVVRRMVLSWFFGNTKLGARILAGCVGFQLKQPQNNLLLLDVESIFLTKTCLEVID